MSTKFSVFLLFLALVGATFFTTPTSTYAASVTLKQLKRSVDETNSSARIQQAVNRMNNLVDTHLKGQIESLEVSNKTTKANVETLQSIVNTQDDTIKSRVLPRLEKLESGNVSHGWLWALMAMVILAVIFLFMKIYDVVGPKKTIAQPAAAASSEEDEEALPAMDGVPPDTGDESAPAVPAVIPAADNAPSPAAEAPAQEDPPNPNNNKKKKRKSSN